MIPVETTPIRRAFAVGCPRSGTTLLQRLISEHPSVATCPETFFFEKMMFWDVDRQGGTMPRRCSLAREQIRKARWQIAYKLNRVHPMAMQTLREVIRELDMQAPIDSSRLRTRRVSEAVSLFIDVLDTYARSQGADCWVEKTPTHVNYINEIEDHLHDAKFVHVIRKNTDAVASLFDMSLRYPDEAWTQRYASIERCCERWSVAVRDSLAVLGRDNHCIFRFEDIVDCYEDCAVRVDHFLGNDPDMRSKSGPGDGDQVFIKSDEPWKSQVFREPKTPEDKFEKLFDKKQKREILSMTSPIQEEIERALPRLNA